MASNKNALIRGRNKGRIAENPKKELLYYQGGRVSKYESELSGPSQFGVKFSTSATINEPEAS